MPTSTRRHAPVLWKSSANSVVLNGAMWASPPTNNQRVQCKCLSLPFVIGNTLSLRRSGALGGKGEDDHGGREGHHVIELLR